MVVAIPDFNNTFGRKILNLWMSHILIDFVVGSAKKYLKIFFIWLNFELTIIYYGVLFGFTLFYCFLPIYSLS